MTYTITDNNYNRLVKKPSVNTQPLMGKKELELFGIREISRAELEDMINIIEHQED